MINEIKRVHEKTNTRERLSIVRLILMQLLKTLDTSTLLNAILHSTFILAFAALLCLDEITWIDENINSFFSDWHVIRSSILLNNTQLQIILSASKTNFFRQRVMLTIAATNDFVCAVISLRHLFQFFSRSLTNFLFFSERSFTRALIIEELKSRLASLDHQRHYFEHSFRREVVIWTRKRDLSDDDIRLLSRWKSDSYKLYLELKKSEMINVSRRIQD
jgi:hypothetical protein